MEPAIPTSGGSGGGGTGRAVSRRRSPLFVVILTVFIDLVGFSILIPLLPFYARDFGASEFIIGSLFASYSLMQFFFSPVWGRVSDRVGRRPVLILCLGGTAVAFAIFGLARSLVLLFAGRILAGLFGGVITTAYAYIADVTGPDDRAGGMGLVGAAFGLGFILGPFIGGLMAEAWGYAAPAFFAAGLALANTVLAVIVLPETYPPDLRRTARGVSERRGLFGSGGLVAALRRPGVGVLLGLHFLITFALANMESTYALLTDALFGWGAGANGLVFGYFGIILVIVQGGLIRPLARRYGEQRLVIAGTALLVPALGLLPFSPGIAVLLLISGVMAIGSGITIPSLSSLISRGVGPDQQGGIMGANQSLGSLARVLGPLWGGFTFGALSRSAPYWSAALLMAGATLLAWHLLGRGAIMEEAEEPG